MGSSSGGTLPTNSRFDVEATSASVCCDDVAAGFQPTFGRAFVILLDAELSKTGFWNRASHGHELRLERLIKSTTLVYSFSVRPDGPNRA